MGKGSKPRPMQISQVEMDFRWDIAQGKYKHLTDEELKKKIKEIRKRTGKP